MSVKSISYFRSNFNITHKLQTNYTYMNGTADSYSMKTLVAIHKILKIYDNNLDLDKLDIEALNTKALKLSKSDK